MDLFASPPPCTNLVNQALTYWVILALLAAAAGLIAYMNVRPKGVAKKAVISACIAIPLLILIIGYFSVRYMYPPDDWCNYQDRYRYNRHELPRQNNPFPWNW